MTAYILSNRTAIFVGANLVCATFWCLAKKIFYCNTRHCKINFSKTWKEYSRVNYKERGFVCCPCSCIASDSFAAPKTWEFTQFVGLDSQTQVRSDFKTYFALRRHVRWDNFQSYWVYKLIKSTKSIQLVYVRRNSKNTWKISEGEHSWTTTLLRRRLSSLEFSPNKPWNFSSFSIRTHLVENRTDSSCVGSFELGGYSVTSVTFGVTTVAAVVSFFLANMRINDILKYFRNYFYFTKPKERATILNVLLNEEKSSKQQ